MQLKPLGPGRCWSPDQQLFRSPDCFFRRCWSPDQQLFPSPGCFYKCTSRGPYPPHKSCRGDPGRTNPSYLTMLSKETTGRTKPQQLPGSLLPHRAVGGDPGRTLVIRRTVTTARLTACIKGWQRRPRLEKNIGFSNATPKSLLLFASVLVLPKDTESRGAGPIRHLSFLPVSINVNSPFAVFHRFAS